MTVEVISIITISIIKIHSMDTTNTPNLALGELGLAQLSCSLFVLFVGFFCWEKIIIFINGGLAPPFVENSLIFFLVGEPELNI